MKPSIVGIKSLIPRKASNKGDLSEMFPKGHTRDEDDERMLPYKMQFLLLGMSQGHITPVIDSIQCDKIVFFTSSNLEQDVIALISEIQKDKYIPIEYVLIEPFADNTLFETIKQIIQKAEEEEVRSIDDLEIVCGLTGGTNLMVISMAIAALIKGWPCHYVVKKQDGSQNSFLDEEDITQEIMHIDLFRELNAKFNLDIMSSYFNWKVSEGNK